jgi:hypothetical protein
MPGRIISGGRKQKKTKSGLKISDPSRLSQPEDEMSRAQEYCSAAGVWQFLNREINSMRCDLECSGGRRSLGPGGELPCDG